MSVGGGEDTLSIGGAVYWLSKIQGASPDGTAKVLFASSTRIAQTIPSDDFEISLLDKVSSGIGIGVHDYNQGQPLLATEPDGLRLPPTTTAPSMPATPNLPIRYWIETQDTNGKWLLIAITPRHIITVDIDATIPVVRRVDAASAIANANDFFGQPTLVLSDASASGTVKPRWLIPLNNGDRIMELTTVGTGGAVGSTLSTWTAFTTVLKGASHFDALPDGRYVRWNSSHTAGALFTTARAEISVLGAVIAARGDLDASWGGDFPVKEQAIYGTALEHFGDLIIACKQDGYYAAVSNVDGTYTWSALLDTKFQSTGDPTTLKIHKPMVWGAQLFLPIPIGGIVRTVPGVSAKPVGLNAIKENVTSDAYSTMIKQGTVATGEACDRWAYFPHADAANSNSYIMAVRRRESDDAPGTNDLCWTAIASNNPHNAATPQSVHRQVNGTFGGSTVGGGRLFFGDNTNGGDISWIALEADGAPVMIGAGGVASFGAISSTYYAVPMEQDFGGPVLLREYEWFVNPSNAHVLWHVQAPSTAGSGVVNGKEWMAPGSSDTVTRYQIFTVKAVTDSGYTATGPGVIAKRLQVRGSYIPAVEDDLAFTIDLERTASGRTSTVEAVFAELEAFRSTRQAFVDRFGTPGQVLIRTVDSALPLYGQTHYGLPTTVQGMPGAGFASCTATLLKYA